MSPITAKKSTSRPVPVPASACRTYHGDDLVDVCGAEDPELVFDGDLGLGAGERGRLSDRPQTPLQVLTEQPADRGVTC